MKVRFRTNVDAYQKNCWPENLAGVPRIGDSVSVNDIFRSYYRDMKFPTRMKVVDVTWYEDFVECELWYHPQDVEVAKCANVRLL